MTTLLTRYTATVTAVLAAIVITGLTGFALDHSSADTLPKGTVEVGELDPLAVGGLPVAALPTVEIVGHRDVMLADTAANAAGSQG